MKVSDVRGRTKYAPLTEFDAVQELATLGSLIPLIYTRRQDNHGGVRAESQLLWSRMRNLPTHQEYRALLLYSAGKIDGVPDYSGYAFGNSKFSGYPASKLALWFSPGLSKEDGNKLFANKDAQQYKEGTKVTGSVGFKPFTQGTYGERRMMFLWDVNPQSNQSFWAVFSYSQRSRLEIQF